MNAQNMKVLINIVGGVESGGQEYGKRRYEAYVPPYTNSDNEHTITLGWAQNCGYSAKKLVQMIFDADPKAFRKIDTAGIEAMLSKDWVAMRWNPNNAQKNVLIKLITSENGKKAQDELAAEDMKKYIANCERDYPKAGVKAQMMYCEICHLGGKEPTDRIFGRLNGDYSLDAIMASLVKDQRDKSNDNQVGDEKYWSRHLKCRQFIDQYSVPEGEEKAMTKTEQATQQMEAWARDDSHGYDQQYRWGQRGDYDCSAAVIQAWQNAGVPVKSNGATYTGNMKPVFLATGFSDVTNEVNLATGAGLRRGDVILNTSHHVAMYCGNGKEVEASINEFGGITGGQPGDQTGTEFLIQNYRNYPWNCVLRYKDSGEGDTYMFEVETVQRGDNSDDVKLMQILLRGRGFRDDDNKLLVRDGIFGNATYQALIKFQKKMKLAADGICGKLTWAALLEQK